MTKQLFCSDHPLQIIPDSQVWQIGGSSLEKGAQIWYTYRSRGDERVDLDVRGPNFLTSKALGLFLNVIQSEMSEIHLRAWIILTIKPKVSEIYILPDKSRCTEVS
ncbi:hypothetical protein J6590_021408 [Homalodisca vitripennis]|nr:hypothetical protein J6590_021408 [Homalodisca vitripennis]